MSKSAQGSFSKMTMLKVLISNISLVKNKIYMHVYLTP